MISYRFRPRVVRLRAQRWRELRIRIGIRIMDDITKTEPLYIKMHERDNVAIVANDGGLPGRHSLRGRS
jgi:hypothetical protein